MKNQETIEGLLKCLDDAIVKRDKAFNKIDNQYKFIEGHILSSEYSEYKLRKNNVLNSFNKQALDYQIKLDNLCKKVRKKQPVLIDLKSNNINIKGRFPKRIALGKYRVQYENLDFYVPKMFKFPFEKPMYICNEKQVVLIHKILLRLLYSLPLDKQKYYLFDPVGLGKNFLKFNSILKNENLFPQQKAISTSAELKEVLKEEKQYIQNLYSSVFNIETDCYDWSTYNKKLYSQKNNKKMLPYKIFIFTSVPVGMDIECFQMFKSLLLHSKNCGFLVLFSFNELLLQADDTKMKSVELELKNCIDNSIQLHSILDKKNDDSIFYKLNITNIGEKFPDDSSLISLLESINNEIEKNSSSMFSFNELLDNNYIFKEQSSRELSIPIGYEPSGKGEMKLNIGDRTPHYLIGGTTGSGKSNFLHNLIMSACWNYSPNELRVYLLDFKEGVEFNRYSNPILPHAKLVATEADTEYGITVLKHIIEELSERFSLFKKVDCKDIYGYRSKTKETMPRILVIIDEFQVLFGNKQRENTLEMLTVISKQGRACGIHLILATQSLKGIDFGSIASQFSGRIALKCSAEDSRQLLGGATSNNEQASELEIPYAIMNTSQGSISGNNKFAIAEAKGEDIIKKIIDIKAECKLRKIETDTNIFDGQKLPNFPKDEEYLSSEELMLTLGKVINYEKTTFRIMLKKSVDNNVLFCGHNDKMRNGFIESIIRSKINSDLCDEIIYVGENSSKYKLNNRCIVYDQIKGFIENYKDNYFETRKILILDNCNLTKEIGFSPMPSYGPKNEFAESFKVFFDEANSKGSHIIAMYEGTNKIKRSGLSKEDFLHVVGFELNSEEMNSILGTMAISPAKSYKNRAFYANNLELQVWFQPFV